MVQTVNPDHKITIEVQVYKNSSPNKRYLLWIKEPEFENITADGDDLGRCLHVLGSMVSAILVHQNNVENLKSRK